MTPNILFLDVDGPLIPLRLHATLSDGLMGYKYHPTMTKVMDRKFIDYLNDLVRNKHFDHDRINEEVKGMTIVTSYAKGGKHTYRVESVDFSKTPNDGFTKKMEHSSNFLNTTIINMDLI